MTDDTKALIEEARSKSRAWGSSDNAYLFAALADALEKAEAEIARLNEAFDGQHDLMVDACNEAEEAEAQLQQTQARLEEAVRFLDALNSSRWPPGTSPVSNFLASLQHAQEKEPRLKGSSPPST